VSDQQTLPDFHDPSDHPDHSEAERIAEERARQLEWSFDAVTEVKQPHAHADRPATPARQPRPLPPTLAVDEIVRGDSLSLLRQVPDACAQLVITSPPYYNQRDYGGVGIGNEATLDAYLNALLDLFGECVRVIGEEGSVVFNLGDKYEDSSLLLVPYRFAIAATERFGVRLVNNVTWVKQNPTPRQFRRRLVSSTEPFFHFVKSDAYYYDIDAFLRDPEADAARKAKSDNRNIGRRYYDLIDASPLSPDEKANARRALMTIIGEVQRGEIPGFRMKIRGVHAEAFGGQEGGRKIQMERNGFTVIRLRGERMKRDVIESPVETVKGCPHPAIYPVALVAEFLKLLTVEGDLVIDPFLGSGSTAVACKRMNRRYLGYDINPDYCEYARQRVADEC
jgi:site-specific DNA-methyltransferase (adenine-specific)